MAHISQVTISGTLYDVYGDEAEFKQYMAGRLGTSSYDNATANDRKKAMVQAARWIDREKWQGLRTDPTTPQPLAFPRIGLVNIDGEAVSSVLAPEDVIFGSFELALVILGDAEASASASQGTNIKKAKAGSAEVVFFRPGAEDGSGGVGSIFPVEAQKLLGPFLSGALGITAPFAPGAGVPSSFDDDNYYLHEGYA